MKINRFLIKKKKKKKKDFPKLLKNTLVALLEKKI